MPFTYKATAFEAVLTSKLLYDSKSWFTENIKANEMQYMSAMQSLLGVSKHSPNEVVMTELGAQNIRDRIQTLGKSSSSLKVWDHGEPLTLASIYFMNEVLLERFV